MSETKMLPAETAIEKAFDYFNKYVRPDRKSHVLLEGLELSPDEKEWVVTIGFDIGREKVTSDSLNPLFSGKAKEPIREFSVIHVNAADGSFIKLG